MPICRENYERNLTFRSVLFENIRRQRAKYASHDQQLSETYDQKYQEWLLKVEEKECLEEKQANDKKMRKYFEGKFKKLRKKKNNKSVFEEILMKKRMIIGAAIPPIMFDKVRKPPPKFDNRNGLLQDPLQIQKQSSIINIWTEEEKEIFTKKFLEQPKKFHFIASFLKNKSVANCVAYYYQSKRSEKYKMRLANLKPKKSRTKNSIAVQLANTLQWRCTVM